MSTLGFCSRVSFSEKKEITLKIKILYFIQNIYYNNKIQGLLRAPTGHEADLSTWTTRAACFYCMNQELKIDRNSGYSTVVGPTTASHRRRPFNQTPTIGLGPTLTPY